MFCGVDQETHYGGRDLGTTHAPGIGQGRGVCGPELDQGQVDLAVETSEQGVKDRVWARQLARGLSLFLKLTQLPGGKRFTPRVGEEPIDHSGKMLYMKAYAGQTRRALPQKGLRKMEEEPMDFFAGLQERVRHRLQKGGHVLQGAAQPYFGQRTSCHC
jgi:hypothetical protein